MELLDKLCHIVSETGVENDIESTGVNAGPSSPTHGTTAEINPSSPMYSGDFESILGTPMAESDSNPMLSSQGGGLSSF